MAVRSRSGPSALQIWCMELDVGVQDNLCNKPVFNFLYHHTESLCRKLPMPNLEWLGDIDLTLKES